MRWCSELHQRLREGPQGNLSTAGPGHTYWRTVVVALLAAVSETPGWFAGDLYHFGVYEGASVRFFRQVTLPGEWETGVRGWVYFGTPGALWGKRGVPRV